MFMIKWALVWLIYAYICTLPRRQVKGIWTNDSFTGMVR